MKNLYTLITGLLFTISANSQCAYNNSYWETKSAPTVVGDSIVTYLYGGEYSTITGLQAGNVYQISTCGDGAFDSQITIYKIGGTSLEAFNDDYSTCALQSRMYFSPFTSGNYDILVDEYNCASNTIPIAVTIKLYDTPYPIITIPTVVHVVYNNSTQNISDAQIQTQIDVLNEDFRRLNTDVFSAPSRFRGFSKDIRVEFCLAERNPNGNPTNGITRTATTFGPFASLGNGGNNEMKYTSMGGKDAWPRDSYLNLWVVDLSGTTLGYAQFPGGAAATDGVVIDYEYVGTIGTASTPFDLGRTSTHEVGHWLDLYHIWGDDGTACTGSDNVNDTPNQGGSSSGCPTSTTSCSNGGYGGDMYVNYMDYSDDACLNMFTYWQYRRMEATLYGSRSSLQSSFGCTPGNAPVANFTANTTVGNAPLTVSFSDLSTNSPTSWSWSFPGASTTSSSSQFPSNITYNSPGTYSVTLTATNVWGNDIETKTNYITVNSTTGITENQFISGLSIYPNPNNGLFTIELTTLLNLRISFKIINVLGQELFNESVGNIQGLFKKQLNLEKIPKGVYTFQIHTEQENINRIIIIE
jgi:PKD repeat protein